MRIPFLAIQEKVYSYWSKILDLEALQQSILSSI